MKYEVVSGLVCSVLNRRELVFRNFSVNRIVTTEGSELLVEKLQEDVHG